MLICAERHPLIKSQMCSLLS